MGLLDAFATAFIQTFGITQPAAAHRRRAAWFIVALLGMALAAVAAVGYALYRSIHR